ncbi:hypothetical protein [Halpernia sp.]|uniref:hypothetical protein n=1 Tax=Halpernia sp. TaxID=2782209 RepID=UPI003A93E0B8
MTVKVLVVQIIVKMNKTSSYDLECKTVILVVGVIEGGGGTQSEITTTKTVCKKVIKEIAEDNTCINVSPNGECNIGDGGGGGGGYPYEDTGEKDPCEKAKEVLNNTKMKPKVEELENFAKTSKDDEIGYKDNKDGTVSPADKNGKHRVTFDDVSTMNGGYHNHTLSGLHMFFSHDISTMLEIARYQGIGNSGNAYLGMVSSDNHYIITFNGNHNDLPANSFSEENLYLWDTKQAIDWYSMLNNSQYSSDKKNLNDTGLNKIFFSTLEKMGLTDKINLIKVNNDGSTSKITKNSDGTISPIPCS